MADEDALRKQVADQCQAVAHLASILAKVHNDYAKIAACDAFNDIMQQVGVRSAELMEYLGDVLNGMDAIQPGDAWMTPIFVEAQRRFPAERKPQLFVIGELVAAARDILDSALENPLGGPMQHPDENDKLPGDSLGKDLYRGRWNIRDRLRKAIAGAESLTGTPEDWPLKARVWTRGSTGHKILEIAGTIGDTFMTCRHTQSLAVADADVPGLPERYIPDWTPDTEIEAAAQACYAVTIEAIRPSFQKLPDWTPQTWDELEDHERELHRGYARAALSTTAPENVLSPEWGLDTFRDVLGERYTPKVWGKHRALHRSALKHVMAFEGAPPEFHDVVAALIWDAMIVGNRAHHAFDASFRAQKDRDADREALGAELRTLIAYARWQMDEGGTYHPTLPSAVGAAEAALRARGLDKASKDAKLREHLKARIGKICTAPTEDQT